MRESDISRPIHQTSLAHYERGDRTETNSKFEFRRERNGVRPAKIQPVTGLSALSRRETDANGARDGSVARRHRTRFRFEARHSRKKTHNETSLMSRRTLRLFVYRARSKAYVSDIV